MFADFIECGNLLNFNDSLNFVSRTGTNMSILSLRILVGISESCEALEQSKFFSSFSIAWISWKQKLTLFSLLVFISSILGWFFVFFYRSWYCIINGIGITSGVFILRNIQVYYNSKKVIQSSDICPFYDMISSSSTRIILSWFIPLSVNNGFAVFENFLLSVTFLMSRLSK